MRRLRLINFIPFSQNPPANQHVPGHVQPTDTPTSTIQQVNSVARNVCKEDNTDHLTMENRHNVNSCNKTIHCYLKVTSAVNHCVTRLLVVPG